jgi:serine/threonine protein kinase
MVRIIVCPGQGCGHPNPISNGTIPITCAKCQASLLGQIPVDPEEIDARVASNPAGQSGQACPRCRERNPNGAGICVFCGAPLTDGVARQPTAPDSPLSVDLARRFDVVEVLPAHSAEADLFVVQPRAGGPAKFLKLYRQGLSPDREVLTRLQSASADHVVRLDEFGEVASGGGMRFFEVQELLPLGSLRAELSQRGKWLPQRVEDLVREMVEALGHLEVSGLRHGDVKPENIMFRAKAPMDLVLTDFGGVQISDASVHVGQLGVFSIDYVAPEAAVGSKDDGRTLHRKSDYFSLGVIVAECLLGRHPVRLESAHARSAVLVKSGAPTDELPERFALLVKGLTAVDPAVRFGKQEVDRWLARDPTLLAPKIVDPQSDGKPYIFNKKPYFNLDALADGMHDAPAVGALWIERDLLAKALSDHFKDHDRAFTVANIAREHGSGPVVLMYCLQVLSPRDYPRLLGVELTHDNLVVASAQAVQGDEAAKRLVDLLWNEQVLVRFAERAEPPIKNPDGYRSIDAAWRTHVADFETTAANVNKHVNAEDQLSTQAPRELRHHALAWAASAQHCTQAAADLTAQLKQTRWPAWFANAVSASAARPGGLVALSMFTEAVRRAAPAGASSRAARSPTDVGPRPATLPWIPIVVVVLVLAVMLVSNRLEQKPAARQTASTDSSPRQSAPAQAAPVQPAQPKQHATPPSAADEPWRVWQDEFEAHEAVHQLIHDLAYAKEPLDKIKRVIEKRPELVDINGVLRSALNNDREDLAKFALNRGADASYQDHPPHNPEAWSPLVHYAESVAMLRLLYANRADFSKVNYLKESVLHVYIEPDMVRFALGTDAPINARDSCGQTPLEKTLGIKARLETRIGTEWLQKNVKDEADRASYQRGYAEDLVKVNAKIALLTEALRHRGITPSANTEGRPSRELLEKMVENLQCDSSSLWLDGAPPQPAQPKQDYNFRVDLDADGSPEGILLKKIGETQDAGVFYQLVVVEAGEEATLKWVGPSKMDLENPLVFGEWHFGVSMPQLVADIDGDQRVELVAPSPQSDISPTSFRVLRWTGTQFQPVFVKSLTGNLETGATFSWTNNPSTSSYWVQEWLGAAEVGFRVKLMRNDGTGNPEVAEGVLMPSDPGYTLLRIDRKGAD